MDTSSPPRHAGAAILIVEDSLTQAEQLRFVLEEQGYAVKHGRNGVEALALLDRERPQAVISDINMPEMDGYELCRRIRASPALASLPVILLTSLSDSEDVVQALACGADYFFTKPYDEEMLGRRLRLIQASHPQGPLLLASAPGAQPDGGDAVRLAASHAQALSLLLSTYEAAIAQNRRLQRTEAELRQLNENLEARVQDRTVALLRLNASLQAENAARRQGESRLREQAELLDKANEAIITAGLDGCIRFWNRGAERLLEWPAAEIIGRPLRDVFALDTAGGEAAASRAFRNLCDWRGELRSQRRSGTQLILETSVTVLRDEAGEPSGWLIIGTDITEQKKLEEKFLRAQRLESIGMLAAGLAHDLNNVLAPIGMACAILRRRLAAAADLRLIDTMEKSVNRGAGMMRQVLGFAQGVGGEHRLVQVKHLLRDIVGVITQTFPKSIELTEYAPTDLWPVTGNATQIHQVLLNLCVNARDAMPDGGRMILRAENCRLDAGEAQAIAHARPGTWIRLEVTDTGTGIPPEVLARIWEPFFTTKPADRGTGLGLSTVRGIVETHGGFLTLETKVGTGTTFRVYLPAEQAAGSVLEAEKRPAAAEGRGVRVLVVDDEEPICETVREVLSLLGYEVFTAHDGATAAALFFGRVQKFALVISDFDMPGLDGSELAHIIRLRHPGTRILAMSGLASPGLDRPLSFGDGWLAKPFTVDALTQAVEDLLRSGPPRR